jgi:hypothetical protein
MRIDRLILRLQAAGIPDAQDLARHIAERLAVSNATRACGRIDTVRLNVAVRPGEPVDEIAPRISDGLLRELARKV